jgi:DUF1680 family protein
MRQNAGCVALQRGPVVYCWTNREPGEMRVWIREH